MSVWDIYIHRLGQCKDGVSSHLLIDSNWGPKGEGRSIVYVTICTNDWLIIEDVNVNALKQPPEITVVVSQDADFANIVYEKCTALTLKVCSEK